MERSLEVDGVDAAVSMDEGFGALFSFFFFFYLCEENGESIGKDEKGGGRKWRGKNKTSGLFFLFLVRRPLL